jgi:hypothetical protein
MRAAYLAPFVGAFSLVMAPLAGAVEKKGEAPQAQVQGPASDEPGGVEGHGAECNPKNPGAVHIKMLGAPGDSFSVTLKCGAVQVARCVATVPAGAAGASCTANGKLVRGRADCSLGRGHNNSPRANPRDWGCAY